MEGTPASMAGNLVFVAVTQTRDFCLPDFLGSVPGSQGAVRIRESYFSVDHHSAGTN